MYYRSGNEASAEGAIATGCRFYAGYPITPSSEIMERMWYLCICQSKRGHPNGLGGGNMVEKETPVLLAGYEEKNFFLDATNVLYYIAFQTVSKGAFLAQTKVARTIYIKEEQVEALKRLSEKTKVPQSVYVREALDMLLERYSDQLKIDFGDYFKG